MQKYHRDLLERRAHLPPLIMPPALVDANAKSNVQETSVDNTFNTSTKKIPSKRPRDRKSRRHRKITAGVKGVDTEVKSFV